jgi:DNA-nicking Smr family endonuclease
VALAQRRRQLAKRDPFDPLDGPVSETLDLHGFRAAEVREQLPPFLAGARKRNPGGLVHIITGKGRSSPGGPVIKTLVRTLLRSGDIAGVKEWNQDPAGGGFLIRF